MAFNSVTYLVFLTGVVALYWALPRRPRLWLLFLASLTFYGFWRVEFIPLLLISALTDYTVGRALGHTRQPSRRKLLVTVSLVVNLGLLFVFKYLVFFADSAVSVLNLLGFDAAPLGFSLVLPLGISFYTFQTISYTIDVYRGFIRPERDFVLFANYVIFFPQLVAGPILRAREVIHQLSERPPFELSSVGVGLRRIAYGLFLKVVLADNIAAAYVDVGFAQPPATLSALDVWTLAFLFGFQIYFDFSAYSHIALGTARLMGIRFPENFDFPYLAGSPRDFWRRWHISLSSWIRDYLYLPLAGARVADRSVGGLAVATSERPPANYTRSLFITWVLMGLWHGAAWTFAVWGVYHSLAIFGYRSLRGLADRLPRWLTVYGGWLLTLAVAMLSWIPFRAESVGTSLRMLAKVVQPQAYLWLGLREASYLAALALTAGMLLTWWTQRAVAPRLRRHPLVWVPVESALFAVLCAAIITYLRPLRQFIYFQF